MLLDVMSRKEKELRARAASTLGTIGGSIGGSIGGMATGGNDDDDDDDDGEEGGEGEAKGGGRGGMGGMGGREDEGGCVMPRALRGRMGRIIGAYFQACCARLIKVSPQLSMS
jgi:hypothetical protein